MVEKLNNTPEYGEQDHEAPDETHSERIKQERERAIERERASDGDVEQLKEEAEKAAEVEKKKIEKEAAPVEKRRDTPAQRRARQKANFKATMKDTQSHMSVPSRTFSKVIHNKTVEKTSEVVGSTVARPNAILAGSLSAFVFTLVIYLVAKYYGYPLSGFETIAAFAIGWIVGLLIDYLRIMITGKKA